MEKLPTIQSLDLSSQHVFLRADLNVPIFGSIISDDFKLKSIISTINFIQQRGGRIILATHLGKPALNSLAYSFDKAYSTQPLATWLENHGYSVFYESSIPLAERLSAKKNHSIILLENLRFFSGEQGSLISNRNLFVAQLAALADIYINDAFGAIHRSDSSVTLLAEKFPHGKKAIGLLIEQEMQQLDMLKNSPQQPFVLILGGKKLTDKLQLLEKFITTPQPQGATTILIGGLLATPFLHALNPSLSLPSVADQSIAEAQQILQQAVDYNVTIHTPTDVTVQKADGTIAQATISQVPSHSTIIDIGPETSSRYAAIISTAKTIFLNGTMGKYEDVAAQGGTKAILQAVALQKLAYKVAGGGDAVASVYFFSLEKNFDFLSTGGGAALAYLATSNPYELPALKALR